MTPIDEVADLLIVGGGVNGCGIARDAAGRGLSVILCEKDDLAQGTSSRSTKLYHGGLRYLEYFEFRLVREALREREVLLRAMPHIARPLRFVLPYHPQMRFEGATPASRLVARVFPWLHNRRPAMMIRLGLFLYDSLGGRKILPATRSLDLRRDSAGEVLDPDLRRAWEYSDCTVDDSRLVVLNARDAAERSAAILTRTEVLGAIRHADHWEVEVRNPEGHRKRLRARTLVNAAGPWCAALAPSLAPDMPRLRLRLVRGSHIVVPKIYDHDRAYILQGSDGRIVFTIPFDEDFTLIGTTDVDHGENPGDVSCSEAESRYLCEFVSRWLRRPVTQDDVIWSFAGVRPLLDDGMGDARSATRDYQLLLDTGAAPLLTVMGGKITTYRKLSEAAVDRLSPYLPVQSGAWTAGVALPGGAFAHDGAPQLVQALLADHPALEARTARRMVRAYGTEAASILRDGPGADLGAGLCQAELDWLIDNEFARSVEDVIWRRSKLGLRLDVSAKERIAGHLHRRLTAAERVNSARREKAVLQSTL